MAGNCLHVFRNVLGNQLDSCGLNLNAFRGRSVINCTTVTLTLINSCCPLRVLKGSLSSSCWNISGDVTVSGKEWRLVFGAVMIIVGCIQG